MKAVLCKQFGPPADLVIEDVAAPDMAADQVRIAVKACGVNFPDILMIAGKYQIQPPLPFSPGAELSGEIVAVGDEVEHLKPGQRVLAMHSYGCMAEEVCLPAAAIVPIPDSMDYVTAASFILTYGTSYHALKQRAALQSGESLLVLGAAGGVGLAAVEIGNLFGAEVFADRDRLAESARVRKRLNSIRAPNGLARSTPNWRKRNLEQFHTTRSGQQMASQRSTLFEPERETLEKRHGEQRRVDG